MPDENEFLYQDIPTKAEREVSVPADTSVFPMVKVKQGAKSYEGVSVSTFVYDRLFKVDQLKSDRAVLDIRGICTAFRTNDLLKA